MKILVFTKNWLGDVLFELPALQAIRENFPDARITVLAPERCQDILKAVPFLDEVRIFDERKSERSLFAKFRFVAWLRRERFDRIFLFHRSFTRAFLGLLGGVPERIGYRTEKRSWTLTQAVPPPHRSLHQVDYFLVLLKWAGLKVRFGAEYEFYYRPENKNEANQVLSSHGLAPKRFAAFHVGANWEPKRWPASHFARLADLVSQSFSCPLVLTGGPGDEKIAREITVRVGATGRSPLQLEPVIDLVGQTSLGTLGALYREAAFVVSSDSGPLHIASGVGTPVVALFGPTCPHLTGPRGTGKKVVLQFVPEGYSIPWVVGARRAVPLPPGGWMEQITPEAVFRRIQEEALWPHPKFATSSL